MNVTAPQAEPMASVLAQTENWIVVNKPAGWLTIPAPRLSDDVPVLKVWAEKEAGQSLWVVHRIDRETSGVLLFARSAEAHRLANSWFLKHQIRKAYDFLAVGSPSMPVFKINSPIGGAASVTQVEMRERFQGAFLGRATPVTGRRHQIRIHLANKGHALLGDPTYRGPREIQSPVNPHQMIRVERVALHAARLELPEGERFEAPWPSDFRNWVEKLKILQECR